MHTQAGRDSQKDIETRKVPFEEAQPKVLYLGWPWTVKATNKRNIWGLFGREIAHTVSL